MLLWNPDSQGLRYLSYIPSKGAFGIIDNSSRCLLIIDISSKCLLFCLNLEVRDLNDSVSMARCPSHDSASTAIGWQMRVILNRLGVNFDVRMRDKYGIVTPRTGEGSK